jgi:multimeric flavodoxin WrbA
MEITILHGQAHKGSTYHITDMIKEKLVDVDSVCDIVDHGSFNVSSNRNDDVDSKNNNNANRNSRNTIVHEYFMPKDTPNFCVGCFQCIQKGEEYCPHNEKVQEIAASMLRSEIIIIDSPTYCYEMTGQLKTLFDHFGYMWMSHRPQKEMFSKIGIVISTAAGAGARRVTKSMAKQLFWWGVPKIYHMNFKVNASCWEEVPEKIKQKIAHITETTSHKVKSQIDNAKPSIKTKFIFSMMRKMQDSNNWNKIDMDYWQKNNWLKKTRPWR